MLRSHSQENHSFLLAIVSSEEFIAQSVASSNGTKMPRANMKDLMNYKIVLPPEGDLEKYLKLASPYIDIAKSLVNQNRNLETIRDLLLPRLISGELDLSDLDLDLGLVA